MNTTVSKPKVWVVQESRHANYSDAERFGEVVFITHDEFKPIQGSKINDGIIQLVRIAADTFTPDDYLVLTGNPIVLGFAFKLFYDKASKAGLDLKVLHWDRMRAQYHHYNFVY